MGVVFDIKEFAVHDGPGIRTTVFLKGCPLRCRWCHNPEGLLQAPQLLTTRAGDDRKTRVCGYEIGAEALAQRLKKSALFPGGGVTFSGGEPLMQWAFVRAVVAHLGGIHTAMETSGYAPEGVFAEMMGAIDLVMLDIKQLDPEAHKTWTGADNAPILRNLDLLKAGDTPFIIRLPLIPGVNDSTAHLTDVAARIAGARALVRVELLPYHKTAGAKYEMAGMAYAPGFDTERAPNMDAAPFEVRGIPVFKMG